MGSGVWISRLALVACLVGVSAQGAGAQAPAPRPAPPTLAEAMRMLDGARAAATKMGVGVACAVVDGRGDLVALVRMDGVSFIGAETARAKAVTSALIGQPSGSLAQMAPLLSSAAAVARVDMLAVQGALPIMRNNQPAGAIGCGGATSQQDEDAARAGLETK